jgi:subtilisin family serine protease
MRKLLLSSLLIAGFILLNNNVSFSQPEYEIRRGERPPIDLGKISPDSWEKGVIRIKFTEDAVTRAGVIHAKMNEQGIVQFDLPPVDALNEQFQVSHYAETFSSAALSPDYTARHQAWGFHRWYTLSFDEQVDIRAMIAAYQALDEIEIAEPEFKKRLIGNAPSYPGATTDDPAQPLSYWTPDDPQFDQQWHYHNTGQQGGTEDADIDLIEAWDIEKGNADVIVAIIDEGIQYTHPDLAGNMWDSIGYNFVSGSPNVNPGNHGTHVAGTVAAVNNNATGVSGIAGGSGNDDGIRLMSAQVFSGSSSGGFHQAPIWAADQGVAISQNSWGYTSPGVYEQSVLDAIDYFNLNGGGDALIGGGITIFAAGNDNGNADYYPGYYSGAFAVAATNNQDAKSWYSNYGTWIDISAPGGETNVVNSRGVLSTLSGGNYGFYQGTSMACPHVSGVAALVVSLAYGELTPDDLADILRNSTDDHYAANPTYIGQLGTGRLNAYNALLEAQAYISGVRNPSSFSATGLSQTEVELNWNANADSNQVLVAFSDSSLFGIPVTGVSYVAGDSIPGGGIVLYIGDSTTFLHQDLESATMYYYRAWSSDDTLAYSTGRSATAMTACDWYELPFAEGFEDYNTLPFCWTQEFVNAGMGWNIGAGNGGSNPPAAFEGSNNTFFRTIDAFNTGQVTRLVTPQLDLSQYGTAELNFYYANPRRTFIFFTFQDVLHVRYKNAADAEWTLLQTFNANVTDWTEVTITLPELSGDYYIAFEAVANYGYGVSIDGVTINGTPLNTYQLDITVVPENAGTAFYEGDLVHGSEVTVTASPSGSEYLFSHWQSGADTLSTDNPYIFEITSDTLIEAHFLLVTSIPESMKPGLLVRPNPNRGTFSVDLAETSSVVLFDLQGRVVYQKDADTGRLDINLPEIIPGAYVLRVLGKHSAEYVRVVIQ